MTNNKVGDFTMNAKDEMFKYLKAVDRQRQLDIERTFKKFKPEIGIGEKGLSGGELLRYRIRKILSRAKVVN